MIIWEEILIRNGYEIWIVWFKPILLKVIAAMG